MVDIPENTRFLELARLNIGEALVEISNQTLRGGQTGSAMANAQRSLHKAIAALDGRVWVAPIDPQHVIKAKQEISSGGE